MASTEASSSSRRLEDSTVQTTSATPPGGGPSRPRAPTTPSSTQQRGQRRPAGVPIGRSLIHSEPTNRQQPSKAMSPPPMTIGTSSALERGASSSTFSPDAAPRSYTANERDVRDSSNRLASLALQDDDESHSEPGTGSAFSISVPSRDQAEPAEEPKESKSPSGLARLLQKHAGEEPQARRSSSHGSTDDGPTPVARSPAQKATPAFPSVVVEEDGETTALLSARPPGDSSYGGVDGSDPNDSSAFRTSIAISRSKAGPSSPFLSRISGATSSWALERYRRARKAARPPTTQDLMLPFMAVPPVILGVLMNILDGVSYGMIMFPTNLPVFADFGGIGVSMFFVTCVLAQLVYTLGGSQFKGGNGSMMIECVPFMHVIAETINSEVGDDKQSVVATTMVAYALSAVLTGLVFFALGALKMGGLMGFFPRHILVGAIGAVGVFLFLTGLEVTARLEDNFTLDLDTLQFFFTAPIIGLWVVPLALAVLLRIVTARFSHPFIVPAYFLAVPLVFYLVFLAIPASLDDLRRAGWIFEVEGVDTGPWEFYDLYQFGKVNWEALATTIPTQLALVGFGLIHVPINIPSLALSLGHDDLDLDRELVAHGFSNTIAGLLGSVPNYLCYINSYLYVRVGGDSRFASFLLACATFGIFLIGPWVIGYLPVCVVGALIFVLGIDLIKEAVWDTFGRVNKFEYLTIWAIIIASMWSDFVIGLLVGIVCACVSFVVTSSQRRAIRTIISGATARSTVRRHPKQTAFLKRVGSQTRILKLQGHLFFGTISAAEKTIRDILDAATWAQAPIRFLIFDFNSAVGMDFSAAEAFLRIQRLLGTKGVVMVISGADADSIVGRALRSVDLWAGNEDMRVEVFEHLNEALEHCENAYLRSLYSQDLEPTIKASAAGLDLPRPDDEIPNLNGLAFSMPSSPRRSHLRDAATETLGAPNSMAPSEHRGIGNLQQPLPLLTQTFRPFLPDRNIDFWFKVAPYFSSVKLQKGESLWKAGDEPTSFYVIEKGILRADYSWPPVDPATTFDDSPRHSVQESMLPGTVAGDHTFLSATPRNADVIAERDAVVWKMDLDAWEKLVREQGPEVRGVVAKGLLRMASEEQQVLMGHLFTTMT